MTLFTVKYDEMDRKFKQIARLDNQISENLRNNPNCNFWKREQTELNQIREHTQKLFKNIDYQAMAQMKSDISDKTKQLTTHKSGLFAFISFIFASIFPCIPNSKRKKIEGEITQLNMRLKFEEEKFKEINACEYTNINIEIDAMQKRMSQILEFSSKR